MTPAQLDAAKAMREALKAAQAFIRNGVELGYIRMPTIAADPATKTPGLIDAALVQWDAATERKDR